MCFHGVTKENALCEQIASTIFWVTVASVNMCTDVPAGRYLSTVRVYTTVYTRHLPVNI